MARTLHDTERPHDNRCCGHYAVGIVVASAATDRRAELARAAYEMIAERGIDGLSLRALARRLGATTGLVSHHFLDKAELIEAALDHATELMLARIATVDPAAHPVDVLAAVLPTDAVTVESWRFAFSVRTAALFDSSLGRFDRTITRYWHDHLPGWLADHVDGDGDEAARHLVALVDGIALHGVLDPDQWTPTVQLRHLRAGFASLRPDPRKHTA